MKNKSNRLHKILIRILFLTVTISLTLPESACQRKVYIPVETVKVISDSTAAITRVSDYIDVSDSVTVIISGDTLIRDRVRTVIRNHLLTDTLIKERTDTIRIEVPVAGESGSIYRQKSSGRFKRGLIAGASAIVLLLLLKKLLSRYIKRL